MKRIFFILLWTTIVCKGYAQDEVITSSNEIITKTMADSAYISNDFASAVMMYETILDKEVFLLGLKDKESLICGQENC